MEGRFGINGGVNTHITEGYVFFEEEVHSIETIIQSLYKSLEKKDIQTAKTLFEQLWLSVADNIETLLQPGKHEPAENMPVKLQEAIVLLIVSKKIDESITVININKHDVHTILAQLKDLLFSVDKQAIEKYGDPADLLKKGVEYYHYRMGCAHISEKGAGCYGSQTQKPFSIQLNTDESNTVSLVLPIEMEDKLFSHQTLLSDQIHLAQTNAYYLETFYGYCRSRLEVSSDDDTPLQTLQKFTSGSDRKDKYVPCDETGRQYLRSLGIGGPLTNQKIMDGKLTIAEAINREAKLIEIKQFLLDMGTDENGYHKFIINYEGVVKYIVDGLLSINEIFSESNGNMYLSEKYQNLNLEGVQKYIDNGRLTIKQALELTVEEKINLESAGVQKYINNDRLTLENARKLTEQARKNLAAAGIRKYIDNGRLTLKEACTLTLIDNIQGRRNLNTAGVQKYIDNGQLTIKQALELTWEENINLNNDEVQKYIDNGQLTIKQVLELTEEARISLRTAEVQKYIEKKQLTLQEALHLTKNQRENLENKVIQKYLDNNKLPINKALILTEKEIANLKNNAVQKYLDNDKHKLSIDKALSLTGKEIAILNTNKVQTRLDKDQLTLEEAFKYAGLILITPQSQTDELLAEIEQSYFSVLGIGPSTAKKIKIGEMTVQGALKLKESFLEKFVDEELRKRVDGSEIEKLKPKCIVDLSSDEFQLRGAIKYIVDGLIPVTAVESAVEFIDMNDIQIKKLLKLNSKGVQKYIDSEKLLIEKAMELTTEQIANLDDEKVQKSIDDSQLTVEEAINLSVDK